MVANSEGIWNRNPGGGCVAGRKLECWNCGGDYLKRNFPKRPEEKEKTKKDNGSEWQARGANDKHADRKTEVKGGQLHIMFTSLVDHTFGTYFSDLGEGN